MPELDTYERYYAEKLWELLPAYYRDLDAQSAPPGALRAFVEVLAEQAAVLRRSQDRLWEDQFIEGADNWAVPYLGDLVATRMVSSMLPRAQRIDVAKTVYYRRRAGTLRVLEELISDIADWEGVARESFQRLARAPHRLDPELATRGGRWSKTAPGALADLRSPLGAELSGSAFDEYHHSVDLRKPRGRQGRYGISRLVFHLYRIPSRTIEGVAPRLFTPGGDDAFFTFDPSGRDVPLFARRTRAHAQADATRLSPIFEVESTVSSWDSWSTAEPWQVPAPIRCRLLGDALYELDANTLAPVFAALSPAARVALSGLYGLEVRGEQRLDTLLATTVPSLAASLHDIREVALSPRCGKAALLGTASVGSAAPSLRLYPQAGGAALAVHEMSADELSDASVTFAAWQRAAIDAERGRFVFSPTTAVASPLVDYHYGFAPFIGAGTYERDALPWKDLAWLTLVPLPATIVSGGGALMAAPNSGVVEISDNLTYVGAASNPSVRDTIIRTEDGRRPYVLLSEDWVFTADVVGNANLALDGLWLGALGAERDVVLRGTFARVEIRACTLDPGGTAADGSILPRVGVRVEGSVELLVVQSSIVAGIEIVLGGFVGRVEVCDSIMQSNVPFNLDNAELHLTRSTLFCDISGYRLWSSDSLIAGTVTVVDVQNGCFRFSAAHEDSMDHVPHPHRAVFFADSGPLFVSTTFGSQSYAMLSLAPEASLTPSEDDTDGRFSIHEGASNDGEMGAYNALLYPIKQRALNAKIEEFLPFGLLPVFVKET